MTNQNFNECVNQLTKLLTYVMRYAQRTPGYISFTRCRIMY